MGNYDGTKLANSQIWQDLQSLTRSVPAKSLVGSGGEKDILGFLSDKSAASASSQPSESSKTVSPPALRSPQGVPSYQQKIAAFRRAFESFTLPDGGTLRPKQANTLMPMLPSSPPGAPVTQPQPQSPMQPGMPVQQEQTANVPLAQAQQQMQQFMKQPMPMAGQGTGQTGLDAAQPVGAANMPGTPGHAATNVIDRQGGLDPKGVTVDGNNAAGVPKGFKMGMMSGDELLDGLFGGAKAEVKAKRPSSPGMAYPMKQHSGGKERERPDRSRDDSELSFNSHQLNDSVGSTRELSFNSHQLNHSSDDTALLPRGRGHADPFNATAPDPHANQSSDARHEQQVPPAANPGSVKTSGDSRPVGKPRFITFEELKQIVLTHEDYKSPHNAGMQKRAYVEPMPNWVSPPASPKPEGYDEFIQTPGAQNLLRSFGMKSEPDGSLSQLPYEEIMRVSDEKRTGDKYAMVRAYEETLMDLLGQGHRKSAAADFAPDLQPADIITANAGAITPDSSRASMAEWPEEWKHGGKGWIEWYRDYVAGERTPEDDKQMQRWRSFRSRHGAQYAANPTERRGNALRNWGIDPEKLLEQSAVNRNQEKTAGRCWAGYEPTPGKTPYSDGSCRPKGSGKKKDKTKKPIAKKTAGDAGDPADCEDCPHCGASMERGSDENDNGRCNQCLKRWPAKTAGAEEAIVKSVRARLEKLERNDYDTDGSIRGGVDAVWIDLGGPEGGQKAFMSIDDGCGEEIRTTWIDELLEYTGEGEGTEKPTSVKWDYEVGDPGPGDWIKVASLRHAGAFSGVGRSRQRQHVNTETDLGQIANAREAARRKLLDDISRPRRPKTAVNRNQIDWATRLANLIERRDPDDVSTEPCDVAMRKKAAGWSRIGKALSKATSAARPVAARATSAVRQAMPKPGAIPIPATGPQSLAQKIVRPQVTPRPELTAQAKPVAPPVTRMEKVTAPVQQMRDRIANVPRGENFGQRPVANTRRLLTLDGVPGMRRVNQAALTGLGASAVSGVAGANSEINNSIKSTAAQLGQTVQASPEQLAQMEDNMHSAKWKTLYDQTIGRAGRAMMGSTPRAATEDKLVTDAAMEGVRNYLHPKEEEQKGGLMETLFNHRTPVATAAAQIPSVAGAVVGEPKGLSMVQQIADHVMEAGLDTSDPTQLESIIAGFFGDTWATLRPEQRAQAQQQVMEAIAQSGLPKQAGLMDTIKHHAPRIRGLDSAVGTGLGVAGWAGTLDGIDQHADSRKDWLKSLLAR